MMLEREYTQTKNGKKFSIRILCVAQAGLGR